MFSSYTYTSPFYGLVEDWLDRATDVDESDGAVTYNSVTVVTSTVSYTAIDAAIQNQRYRGLRS